MINKKEVMNELFGVFSSFHKIKKFSHRHDFNHQDIKPSEQILLFRMNDHMKDNKIIITDIVNILELAPPTVSLMLNSLEEHGYIERTVNKDNRREVYVSYTEKGKKVLDTVKESHQHLISELIDYLGEEDTNNLISILKKIKAFAEKQEEVKKGN